MGESSIWAAPGQVFLCFCYVLDQFVGFRETGCVFFYIEDAHGHIFAPAGGTRLQIRRQIGHQVGFCPPPEIGARISFVTFSYASELHDFMKIEPPHARELNFEDPGQFVLCFFVLD